MSANKETLERNFLDRNPGPIVIVDNQGALKYLNPAARTFLESRGMDESDYTDLLPPGYVDIFQNCIAAEVSIPVTRIEYGGAVLLWSSFFGQDKEEVLYHGVDITRLHRNEVALTVAKEKAEEGERLKAAFLDNMSHEIRTPLNSLLGFMNLLSEELSTTLSDDQSFYFDLIQQNGDRLARTMQEILDISHFSSGTYQMKRESNDVVEIVKLQVANIRKEAEAKGLAVITELPDLPHLALTDEYCLRQAVAHLVDNAVKYTDEGHILVGVDREDDQIVIRIEDTGPGMDDEMQRRIFVAFSQGSIGHSKQYQGIGLGLSLVRVYVDTIEATVDLDSTNGGGSRFKIFLPA